MASESDERVVADARSAPGGAAWPVGPRLYLIGRPAFDVESFLEFLAGVGETWEQSDGATDSEQLVEVAGRVCYMSFGRRQHTRPNRQYISNLIAQGHESVIEHVNWTFVLEGVSRAFSHQFVRHRVGFSFSQLSQQYHEESDALFLEPAVIRSRPLLSASWRQAIDACRIAYDHIITSLQKDELLQLSIDETREVLRTIRAAARSVLPNATETKIVFTANARALRHFLALRGSIVGDEEMRIVSRLLLECVSREAPALFQDFEVGVLPDGLPIVRQVPISDAGRRESDGARQASVAERRV